LAVWLNLGRGGKVDKARAFQLCKEAADAGHIGAIFNTGVYYMSGQGVEVDLPTAAEWFEKASQRGVVHAAMNLSKMHWEGVGIPKDLVKAEMVLRGFVDSNEDCRMMRDEILKDIATQNTTVGLAK
jgi:TPR repeat protein